MAKYLTNNFSVINIHKKPSLKSEVVTQMIYGDRFSIFKRSRKWLKIKIKEDGYNGYIKNKKFSLIAIDPPYGDMMSREKTGEAIKKNQSTDATPFTKNRSLPQYLSEL